MAVPLTPGPRPDARRPPAGDGAGHHVAVLLATHNGARWLDEQLASIAGQDIAGRIDIHASDDNSTDGTRELLSRWQGQWSRGDFTIASGPGTGFADNFRSLILAAPTEAAFVAFSDQDDIWLESKLGAATAAIGEDGPALHGSRTTFVDAEGRVLAMSQAFKRAPSFRNALAQNIIAGNTAVLNREAFAILRTASERTDYPFHDWFAYLIVSGAGGRVHYAPTGHLLYRQHGGNAVGGSIGIVDKADRIRRSLRGAFRDYVARNVAALRRCEDLLTPEARSTLDLFDAARTGAPAKRLRMLKASGVHRQTASETLMLYAAALIDRL